MLSDKHKPKEVSTQEVEERLAKHMKAVQEKAAEEAKKINLPGYLNPAMVNVHQFKQVQDKRKLLWSKPKDKKEGAALWSGAFDDQQNDQKFKRLMGIQGVQVDSEAASKVQESRRVLDDLEKEYEKSRAFQMSRGFDRKVEVKMFGRQLVTKGSCQWKNIAARNLHLSGAVYQAQQKATDPIQQLFVTKIREYAQKKKQLKSGEVLVDASPEVKQNYSDSLNRIYKMYSLTEANSRNVPELKFEDKAVEITALEDVEMKNFTTEFPEDKIELAEDNPHNLEFNQRVFGYSPERSTDVDVPSKIKA